MSQCPFCRHRVTEKNIVDYVAVGDINDEHDAVSYIIANNSDQHEISHLVDSGLFSDKSILDMIDNNTQIDIMDAICSGYLEHVDIISVIFSERLSIADIQTLILFNLLSVHDLIRIANTYVHYFVHTVPILKGIEYTGNRDVYPYTEIRCVLSSAESDYITQPIIDILDLVTTIHNQI